MKVEIENLDTRKLAYNETYAWTSTLLKSLRNSMDLFKFDEIVPTPFSRRYEPGAKHSVIVLGDKTLPDIRENGDKDSSFNSKVEVAGEQYYYMSVSHVVEKQMATEYLPKVYCLAPCLRLLMEGEELSAKHIYSFFQFEIEWRTERMEDVFDLGEKILYEAGNKILSLIDNNDNLTLTPLAKRNTESLVKGSYPRITFEEALERVGRSKDSEGDLTSEEDALLSNQFDTPFWIYNYPAGVRDSIYHESPKGVFQTYDLMLPFGYGELTTGGIRPTSGEEIINQSKTLGNSYHPEYAQWKDKSQVQTAGFGIGLERLLKFISGAESILDFIQYHDAGPNTTITRPIQK